MRYDSLKKANRNEALIEYRRAHPDLSLKEIGEVFGITKQRVHEIIAKYGVQRKVTNGEAAT